MKNAKLLLLLVVGMFFLNGCALLQVPGQLMGGVFNLLGGAMNIAKKLPWWMWI